MKSIKSIIKTKLNNQKGIERFKYSPYSSVYANIWLNLVKDVFYIDETKDKFQPGEQQTKIWEQLIKYIHCDDTCKLNINKSIFIFGQTGTGKSLTMEVLNKYIEMGDVIYRRDKKVIPFKFSIKTSREIVSDYLQFGYDGIVKYLIVGNLCIDDLGNEIRNPQYYGNKLDVLSEIIEIRYTKGFLTHFTSNLSNKELLDTYNDRVYSRLIHQCNMLEMNDRDFRISIK